MSEESESREQMLDDFAQRGDVLRAYSDGINMIAVLNCRAQEFGPVTALGNLVRSRRMLRVIHQTWRWRGMDSGDANPA